MSRLIDRVTLLGLVGPDARPSTEAEASESANHPAEPTDDQEDSVRRGRNLQNTFMQRMSDIFTQLVTRTTSETEHASDELESHNIPSTAQPGPISPTRTAESQQTHNSTTRPSTVSIDDSTTVHRNAHGNEAEVSSSSEMLVLSFACLFHQRAGIFDFLVDEDRILPTADDRDDAEEDDDDEDNDGDEESSMDEDPDVRSPRFFRWMITSII